MAKHQIYYVGTEAEVAHHAAPLQVHCAVRVADPATVKRVARAGDVAIFFSEHFHRFREAWWHLKRQGCHTLYALDGILEWRNAWENRSDEPACPWTMRPVLCDKVACIGDSQARVLDAWGNVGKSEVVGIPRLESLRTDPPAPRERDGRFRLLVTTAKWPGFTPRQRNLITRSLVDLKAHLADHPTINGLAVDVVWRLTGDLDRVLQVNNQLSGTCGSELSQLLAEVDAVVTSPSTVMLEAMLCDLPVALLDYTNSPSYVPAAWNITAPDHLQPVLQQLAGPSPRRLFLQRSQLRDALQCDQDASQRLALLIHEMLRIGHDCQTAQRPVQFPAHILPPLKNQVVWDAMPQQRPFLGGEELLQSASQAVVSESLRRVNHLQHRVDLLERELTRAAEGFQRIACHPILAPLVKVRKIALGMAGGIADVLGRSRQPVDEETRDATQPPTPAKVKVRT